jgi:hypothetical protein
VILPECSYQPTGQYLVGARKIVPCSHHRVLDGRGSGHAYLPGASQVRSPRGYQSAARYDGRGLI